MARHINYKYKQFIKNIQRRVAETYNKSTTDSIEVNLEPAVKNITTPDTVRHRIYTRLHNIAIQRKKENNDIDDTRLDSFEREYQAFIAKLKAKKELNNIEEVKPVEEIIEPVVIQETVEPEKPVEVPPKKKRTRKKKTETDTTDETKNITKKKRTRKTKQKIEE